MEEVVVTKEEEIRESIKFNADLARREIMEAYKEAGDFRRLCENCSDLDEVMVRMGGLINSLISHAQKANAFHNCNQGLRRALKAFGK